MKIQAFSNFYQKNIAKKEYSNKSNIRYNSLKQDTVSFSGMFGFNKLPSGSETVSPGERRRLPKNERVYLGDDSMSLYVGRYEKIDLATPAMKEYFSKIKKGQQFILGRNYINQHDMTISSNHVILGKDKYGSYVEDISLNGTRAFGDSRYKNYDKEYLDYFYKGDFPDFIAMFDRKYNHIRLADYSYNQCFPIGHEIVQKAISEPDNNVMKLHQNGWVYRKFPNMDYRSNEECERMSLNVVAHPSLIYSLDNFFRTGRYWENGEEKQIKDMSTICAYYKTPNNAFGWTKRHDPITIYSCKPVTEEFKNAICSIAKNFQRPNNTNIPLCGTSANAPFMSHEKEASEEAFEKIKRRANRFNPNFAKAMYEYCYDKNKYNGEYRFRSSTGMLLAIEMVLDEYIEYLHQNKQINN